MKIDPIYRSIGAIIRSRRRHLELSQEQLARQMRVSRAALASMEIGRQRILVHQLYALASSLGMKPEDLLPRPTSGATAEAWKRLPIPEDLKPQQKEQIGRLIEGVDLGVAPLPERPHDKT